MYCLLAHPSDGKKLRFKRTIHTLGSSECGTVTAYDQVAVLGVLVFIRLILLLEEQVPLATCDMQR